MNRPKKNPTRKEMEYLLKKKLGLNPDDFDVVVRCFLCKGKINPPNERVDHNCAVKFNVAGTNPCKHRGSEFLSATPDMAFGVHRCVKCDFTWVCRCANCELSKKTTSLLVENDFQGSPIQPSCIKCVCGAKSLRTLVECPMISEEGDMKVHEGCEVEYPHYHVKCYECKVVEMVEEEDVEAHRLKPGEASRIDIQ